MLSEGFVGRIIIKISNVVMVRVEGLKTSISQLCTHSRFSGTWHPGYVYDIVLEHKDIIQLQATQLKGLVKSGRQVHYEGSMGEKYYPSEENLGKDCQFWQGYEGADSQRLARVAIGCFFPKREMEGRVSCEGCIDDVCLFLKNGRRPQSLTRDQVDEIRTRIPSGDNKDLPPGDIY
jgi:hypothetical protein